MYICGLYLGWVWFSFFKLSFLKKCGMKKCFLKKLSVWFNCVHLWSLFRVSLVQLFKTELFGKLGFLKSAVWKSAFWKKLSVWLALIKVVVWVVNYQKEQCTYKIFSKFLKKIIFFSPILTNNNLPLKIYCESIVKILS